MLEEGGRRRRRNGGYSPKNKNPTRQCGEKSGPRSKKGIQGQKKEVRSKKVIQGQKKDLPYSL